MRAHSDANLGQAVRFIGKFNIAVSGGRKVKTPALTFQRVGCDDEAITIHIPSGCAIGLDRTAAGVAYSR